MTQRIIETPATAGRDEDLTDAAVRRLQDLAKDDQCDPLEVFRQARTIASEVHEPWTAEKQAAALAYIEGLAEPHRTIFLNNHKGMKPGETARELGLPLRPVLKSLSKVYAALLHI